jgi:hypothetical protein
MPTIDDEQRKFCLHHVQCISTFIVLYMYVLVSASALLLGRPLDIHDHDDRLIRNRHIRTLPCTAESVTDSMWRSSSLEREAGRRLTDCHT